MSKNFWAAVGFMALFAAMNLLGPMISGRIEVLPLAEGVLLPTIIMILVRLMDKLDQKSEG